MIKVCVNTLNSDHMTPEEQTLGYLITDKHQIRKLISANLLASLTPKRIGILIKSNTTWIFEPPDKDSILTDYVSGPFPTIQDAFDLSITCHHFLLINTVYQKITTK